MRGEKVRAVKAQVLDRYYNWVLAKIRQYSRNRTNSNRTDYARARKVRDTLKGMVSYNKMYLQQGLNPVMFIEAGFNKK